jgi:hypothetical protein
MFVKILAKTEMLGFWQKMFNYCNEDFNCVLGWLTAGIVGFLALLLSLGYLVSRANKRRE